MHDMTLGCIIAIKENNKDGLKKFLAEYCHTKEEDYTDFVLERILRHCLTDYIETVDNPSYLLTTYFSYKYDTLLEERKDIDTIISVFLVQQVRKRNNDENLCYVNGFRDFEFGDWKLKLEETPRTTYEI